MKPSKCSVLGIPPHRNTLGSPGSLARQVLYHVLGARLVFYLCYVNSSYPQYYTGRIITLFYKTQNRSIGRLWIVQVHTHLENDEITYVDSVGTTTLKPQWSLSEQLFAGGSHYWGANRTTFQASRQEALSLWCRAMYVTEASRNFISPNGNCTTGLRRIQFLFFHHQ